METLPTHPLNAEDQKILAQICAPESDIALTVGANQGPEEILRYLYILTRASITLERKRDGLVQVIGRILHVVRENPAIYQARGFKSFDGFIKGHVVNALGMSKSTLRDAMRIYEAFPTTSAADVAEVGVVKMVLLSRITNSTQPNHGKLIEEAKSQTYRQLLQTAAEKANLRPTDIERAVLVVQLSIAQKAMVKSFLDHPQVRAKCQTEDWGTILEYMIAEVMGEWCQG